MNIYFWFDISNLTDSYHDGGSIAIIAPNLDAARDMLRMQDSYQIECPVFNTSPDAFYQLKNNEAMRVFVFPDAGCC